MSQPNTGPQTSDARRSFLDARAPAAKPGILARRARVVRLGRFGLTVVLVLAVLFGSVAIDGRAVAAPRSAPSNLTIVMLADGAEPLAAARDLGANPVYVYTSAFSGFAAELPAAAASASRRSGLVAAFSPDAPVHTAAQSIPSGVSRVAAEPAAKQDRAGGKKGKRGKRNGVDADVAVLDTGISKHRDLRVNVGKACIGNKATRDRDGHGTHVAGIIGAKNNDIDVVGVAPGARLWSVKVLDATGEGTRSSVICGLDWVHKNRETIDVVNMSLANKGTNGPCRADPYHQAVCRVVEAGIPVVVAAGNGPKSASSVVPAAWPETIAVSAFADSDGKPGGIGPGTCSGDADDSFAFFSNFGPDVDIAAPGVCILSTWQRSSTRFENGTSQAAPHVTGAIARYKADHPRANAVAARAWLLSNASRPQGSPEGFTDDIDTSPEPVLFLGP